MVKVIMTASDINMIKKMLYNNTTTCCVPDGLTVASNRDVTLYETHFRLYCEVHLYLHT